MSITAQVPDGVDAPSAADLVREARRRRGMSQRALAAAAGVSHTIVARIETGKTQPTLPTISKLLAGAGFTPEIELVSTAKPSDLVRAHKQQIIKLAAEHGVRSLEVFGSVAQGTDTPGSDLDLLVEFDDEVRGLDRIDFAEALEELLGVEIDMVNPASASSEFMAAVSDQARDLADL